MKKVSTVAVKQSRNIFQPKLTIGLGSGRPDAWKHLLWDCLRISCRLRHLCLELNSTEDAWFLTVGVVCGGHHWHASTAG
jgi:hypothetical protein